MTHIILVITIWMIWKMKNYTRFQQNIFIQTIKLVIRLARNALKNTMCNDMVDFLVLKSFIDVGWVKINMDNVLCWFGQRK